MAENTYHGTIFEEMNDYQQERAILHHMGGDYATGEWTPEDQVNVNVHYGTFTPSAAFNDAVDRMVSDGTYLRREMRGGISYICYRHWTS